MTMIRCLLLGLLLSCPLLAETDYATAAQAKLPPAVLKELAKLKSAGISEVLVPTWFPDDLLQASGTVDVSDTRFGPEITVVWSSSRAKEHGLVLRGIGGGLGGPGPDSTVTVENSALGPIEMWICVEAPMSFRYGTAYGLKVPRSGDGGEYFLDLQTVGNSANGLSKGEMQKILASARKLKL